MIMDVCISGSFPGQQLLKGDLDRFGKLIQIVSALEGKNHWNFSNGKDSRNDFLDANSSNLEVGERIIAPQVVSGRDKDHVRTELFDQCGKNLLIDSAKIRIVCPSWKWHIAGKSGSPPVADLAGCTGTREVRELVRAEIKHRFVFFEKMLRSVAVMNVEINDENLLVP